MPTLCNVLNLPTDTLEVATQQAKIKDYWNQDSEKGYRIWKTGNHVLINENIKLSGELERELSKRKIRCVETKDILRWGHQPKGAYTTKEAYKILCNDSAPQEPI